MASKNVETLRKSHDAFNRRDFEATAEGLREDTVYRDMARNQEMRGVGENVAFLRDWATAFSNAEVHEPKYVDAGDTVVAEFTGRGLNDGPLGDLPPTGKEMTLAFCEVAHFDEEGKVVRGEIYYDQMSMLMQLGHVKGPDRG